MRLPWYFRFVLCCGVRCDIDHKALAFVCPACHRASDAKALYMTTVLHVRAVGR